MVGVASRGASAGSVVGVVVALLNAVVVLGDDEYAVLYVVVIAIAAIVGAVMGAVCLVAAAWTVRRSSSAPARRRRDGALAAGLVAVLLTVCAVPVLLAWGPLLLLVTGGLAVAMSWWLLPGVVDLEAPPGAPALPPWGAAAAPAPQPRSLVRRAATTVAVAGVVAWVGTQLIMSTLSLDRQTGQVVAIVVLAASFAGVAAIVWRRLRGSA